MSESPNDVLDWLVIGGGIHGVHASVALLTQAQVPRARLRILDPQPGLLARWRRCTANVAMQFLRSPSVHHLDVPAFSLAQFAGFPKGETDKRFAPPYHRPSLGLFNAHCDALIEAHELGELHLRGAALDIEPGPDFVRVQTSLGELRARRILLAIGAGDQPAWPAWAQELREQGVAIDHVFAQGFAAEELPDWNHAVVVGGGISAVQLAMRLGARRPGAVTLLTRGPLREAQFDSDPGWLGPLELHGFAKLEDPVARRRAITGARHRGSSPRDVLLALRRARRAKRVIVREGEVVRARFDRSLGPELWLREGEAVHADQIVLATGFSPQRPGPWLDPLIARAELACAPCGFPIVDQELRWHPRIHVSGPLAELELGPAARNIAGARMAAQRILRSLGIIVKPIARRVEVA